MYYSNIQQPQQQEGRSPSPTSMMQEMPIAPSTYSASASSEGKNIKIIPNNSFIQNKIAGHILVEDHEATIGMHFEEGKTSRSISNASSITSTCKLIEMQETKHIPSKYIDFATALDYFITNRKDEVTEIKKNLKYTQKEGELTTVSETYCFCLTRKNRVRFETLEHDQLEELRNFLALMTVPFKNSNSIHVDICMEVFHAVMGRDINLDVKQSSADEDNITVTVEESISIERIDKLPITNEWELIGFLGPNLEEEFRGFGIFGALMLLHFCTHHHELSEKIFTLSKDEKKHFPFVISVLHLLKIAIDLIKAKRFNKYINENQSVLFTIQVVHAEICREFLKLWSTKSYTELDFHHVIEAHSFEITKKESTARKLLLPSRKNSSTTTVNSLRVQPTTTPSNTSPSSPSSTTTTATTTLKNRALFK